MENNCNFLKQYVDRFISENYIRVTVEARKTELVTTSKKENELRACSSVDIVHDMLLSLYETKETFNDYCSFEKWAMKKFTQK